MQETNIPHAFATALAQDTDVANTYAMMTREEKDAVLEKARKARTKGKMQKIVTALAQEQQL